MSFDDLLIYLQNLQPSQRKQEVQILLDNVLQPVDVAEMGISRRVVLVPLFEGDNDDGSMDETKAS